MAAREARYKFLAAAAKKHRCKYIAIAHHADDQAETFLWRMMRGAGGEGLRGMQVLTDFVEKPETFVSDLAIIGIYYFKDGNNLKNELQYLLDNNIKDKGEYQLTNALENMKNKGKNRNKLLKV